MNIQLRTVKGSKARSKTVTPGVMYGKGIESVAIQADANEFSKTFSSKGTSKTFEVTLEGTKHIVYIKDTQFLSGNLHVKSHFDLVKVSKDDTMTSKVNLVFVNHQLVEKRGLIVNSVYSQIEIEYAVGSGISSLELDVAELNEFDTLLVSDIVLPKGIKVLDALDDVVVSISSPKEEVLEDEDAGDGIEAISIKQKEEE